VKPNSRPSRRCAACGGSESQRTDINCWTCEYTPDKGAAARPFSVTTILNLLRDTDTREGIHIA
jgi:ribosomal protein L37AE/L43A